MACTVVAVPRSAGVVTVSRLDRDFDGLGLVCWQGRPPRRGRPKAGPATAFFVLFALAAAGVFAAQMLGYLHWKGPLAFTPAVLMLVALNAQLIAAARWAAGWLAG
jgi:hypothetical protein